MTSQPNVFTDCRFCLEKKRHVLPITPEMNVVYHTVTQMKLAHLHSYSNSVCLLCYKKLLSAQSYREMLIQIEQKLLSTFNHSMVVRPIQIKPQINKAIRSNGAPKTLQPTVIKPDVPQKFARQQMRQHSSTLANEDDDDMSLLEEIVSFDGANPSEFIDEEAHDNQYTITSEDDTKDQDFGDDEASSSFQIKDEPIDSPVMNETDNGWTPRLQGTPEKPFKCSFPGCRTSSTSRTALLKHRRRVHNIRMRQSLGGGKITRARPSQLYNDLELSNCEFKCRFCNLKLRNRRVLLRHIETVHMQAKFYCTVAGCNHASTRKDNYRLHLKNYHRDLPVEQMERVLAETRDMKPIYENDLLELQVKKEELQKQIANESGNVGESNELDGLVEIPGYSLIDIGENFE